MADPKVEEVKILTIREASFWESVLLHSNSREETVSLCGRLIQAVEN